jgi:hypothetical protein
VFCCSLIKVSFLFTLLACLQLVAHPVGRAEYTPSLISILENYSRAVLASKVSPTQNQWDYLEVLFAAFSTAGIPKAIVSDGGGIFYANQAMHVYQALGIQKERIEPKQAWQNYVRRVGIYLEFLRNAGEVESETTSRIMTYLEGKPEEENSMSLKWRKVEGM